MPTPGDGARQTARVRDGSAPTEEGTRKGPDGRGGCLLHQLGNGAGYSGWAVNRRNAPTR